MKKINFFSRVLIIILLFAVLFFFSGCVSSRNNNNVNQEIEIEYLPFKVESRVLLKEVNLHINPYEESRALKILKPNTIVSVSDVVTIRGSDEVWLYVTLIEYEEPVNIKGWIRKDDTNVLREQKEIKNNNKNNDLGNELIVEQINSGLDLYSLFEVDSLPFNSEIRKKFPDLNPMYYLVNAENINTIANIKNMLTTVFTEEMAEKILKSYDKVYVEEDGSLYTCGLGGAGPYIFWNDIFVKKKEIIDDNTIIVHVYLLFPAISKEEPLTYKIEKFVFKNIQGKGWRLDSFYLVK